MKSYFLYFKTVSLWSYWLVGPPFSFYGANSPVKTHFFVYYLVTLIMWSIHISCTVMKKCINWSTLRWNNTKHVFGVVTELFLWSIMSNRDTHLANSSLIPKVSYKLVRTAVSDLRMVITFSRTPNLRSGNTISWVFSIVSQLDIEKVGSQSCWCDHKEV